MFKSLFLQPMQHKIFSLRVSSVKPETTDAVTIDFEVPDQLKNEFKYHSGQHITLIHPTLGESVKRSYSMCSAPYENKLQIASRRVTHGLFSNFLNDELKVGDEIQVEVPDGRFFIPLDPSHENMFVFFASGSGITPILSHIKEILHTETKSRIQLFYGNRHTDSIMFLEELMALKNIYPERLSLHFLLSREELEEELFHGRISAEKLDRFVKQFFNPEEVDAFFMCGPESMLLELREKLLNLGVPGSKIHLELFGVQIPKPAPKVVVDGDSSSLVRVTLDGRTFEYSLPFNTESILDSALQQGAKLPFACKGGVCCTCKAKLLKGEVEMVTNYGLEPEEVKNSYILTCQSYPKTPKVELSFDQ
ncbi:MAG: 2Fe-2S iron-sulfur cluster binding domain-containing protein [Saprospiraceae bacterium]|nr:2Fe-2S iron-sulfur cluster binding domain-containing protein [Saprospiraceae bacterium]